MPVVEKHIIDLAQWFGQPAGQYLLEWEQQVLDQLTADIFGYNALQIGMPEIHGLAASRMVNRWLSDAQLPEQSKPELIRPVVILHDFAELPFANQSIDLVILPHVLEFAAEPHQVLREVERILIPEGHLIICGLNRASLWGARQFAGKLFKRYYLPKHGEFISHPRLKDWLKLLSLEIVETRFGCYVPAFQSEAWLQRYAFMEKAGARWWPVFGASYVLHAVKRVRGMHLIGPAWKTDKAKAGKAVPAANKLKDYGSGRDLY